LNGPFKLFGLACLPPTPSQVASPIRLSKNWDQQKRAAFRSPLHLWSLNFTQSAGAGVPLRSPKRP